MKITTIFALSLSLALASNALATEVLDEGLVSVDYAQFPVGPYVGSFLSDGSISDPDAFPPGGTGASIAIRTNVAGVHYMVVLGGKQNVDSSIDGTFLFLRSPVPFATGVYPIDPVGFTAIFGFVDDASEIDIPEISDLQNWQAWVAGIIAEHKLLSASGAIMLTSVTDGVLEGTFSGLGAEFGGGIMASFTNGVFSIGPEPLAVEGSSWGAIKSLYR
jgi:hypothetical protein